MCLGLLGIDAGVVTGELRQECVLQTVLEKLGCFVEAFVERAELCAVIFTRERASGDPFDGINRLNH